MKRWLIENIGGLILLLIIVCCIFMVSSIIKMSTEKTEAYDIACIEKGGTPLHLREGNKCIRGELIE